MPQTAKCSHVLITNSRFLKRAGQRFAVELGIVPRAWDGSNIDQLVEAVSEKQSDKLLQGSG